MRHNVFVCPSCPEPRKQMHLCDLREHIAEAHLDHFHTYFCPKCKEKFATAFKAHKHIREVCRVEGVVPMHEYTQAALSYDSAYLTKMYELELAAIFKYVQACDRKARPKTVNAKTNTEILTVDAAVQVRTRTTAVECQTTEETRGSNPFASPTDEEPGEPRPSESCHRPDPPRKTTTDQSTECSSSDNASAGDTILGSIRVKREPNAEEEVQQEEVRSLSKFIKPEPVEELPPPASPESNNSSVACGPPSEFDDHASNADVNDSDDCDVKNEDDTECQTVKSSSEMDGDAPCTSNALPDLDDDIQIIEPEEWEQPRSSSRASRKSPKSRKCLYDEMRDRGYAPPPPSRIPSLMDWEILSPNLTVPERIFKCMKVIINDSTYPRVIAAHHICEYENCCEQDVESECMFCFGRHYSSNCSSYPTLDSRRAQAQNRPLCMRCGRDYHGHHCSGITCTFCGKTGHHPAFCWDNDSKNHMVRTAHINFPRWLPKIPELDALTKRRGLQKIKPPRPERPSRNSDSPLKKRRRDT